VKFKNMKSSHTDHDYGFDLYQKEWFSQLFPKFETRQKAAAESLSSRIIQRIVDGELPSINTWVYLGCGDGSLLKYLCDELDQNCPSGTNKIIAIDKSQNACTIAEQKFKNTFYSHLTLEFKTGDESILAELDIDWEQSALLILGHTWFHLHQKTIQEQIQALSPSLIILSLHQHWDESLNSLPYMGHSKQIKIDGKKKTCWLRTEPLNELQVQRGIWLDDDKQFLFRTTQARTTTKALLGEGCIKTNSPESGNPSESEILRELRNQGELTGEEQLDYNCAYTIKHTSGWGPMTTYVLTSRSSESKLLNEAYFSSIKACIVKHLIELDSQENRSKYFQLFNSSSTESKDETASCTALAILPFDPRADYGRMISLNRLYSGDIQTHDLLIETPNLSQTKFPSGFGLYMTMLSQSSAPQAFTLQDCENYIPTYADSLYEKIEQSALQESDTQTASDVIPTKKEAYFMLPIYFGSLPLFTLALRFPSFYSPDITGFDVFFSVLKNLHDSIRVNFTDQFVSMSILRPFIERVLLSDWQTAETLSVKDKLTKIEHSLFGISQTESNLHARLQYNLGDETRAGGVLGKEWKSWILGLPSYPIKKMESVKKENARLLQCWKKERDFAELDHAMKISHWFQEGHFFEGEEAHDEWNHHTHPERINDMIHILGCTNNMDVDKALDSAEAKNYFGKETTEHFLFKWMKKQLRDSMTKNGADKNEIFANLKSVYCKSMANKGQQVRYANRRLKLLCEAALTKNLNVSELSETPSLESKFWSEDDPCQTLADFLLCLKTMNKIKDVIISEKKDNPNSPVTITVTINLTNELSVKSGGSDCDKVSKAHKNIKRFFKDNGLFGKGTLEFSMIINHTEKTITPKP